MKASLLLSALLAIGLFAVPDTADAQVDPMKCYKIASVKQPRFVPVPGVQVADQFVGTFLTVKKPFIMCTPADVEQNGVNDQDTLQCCYKIKAAKLDPAEPVATDDAFGTLVYKIRTPQLICMPCTLADE